MTKFYYNFMSFSESLIRSHENGVEWRASCEIHTVNRNVAQLLAKYRSWHTGRYKNHTIVADAKQGKHIGHIQNYWLLIAVWTEEKSKTYQHRCRTDLFLFSLIYFDFTFSVQPLTRFVFVFFSSLFVVVILLFLFLFCSVANDIHTNTRFLFICLLVSSKESEWERQVFVCVCEKSSKWIAQQQIHPRLA